ncbi:hypothetical protein ACFL49_00770 [Candidatus Omnitrophota bacterium]
MKKILILTLVFLIYLPVLSGQFLDWDDDDLLVNNPAVRVLDIQHVKSIFTQSPNGMYTPLTVLSFALEHHFVGYNAFVYHLNNLILHLLNTFLVYVLAQQLGISVLAAGLASLLFGIHPMHVESVAWISERKDVLYAFFYLLSVILYLKNIDRNRWLLLILSMICAMLSILAKPMAVSLPFVLFCCDWWVKRKASRKILWDKVPYFCFLIPVTWITYVNNLNVGQDAGLSISFDQISETFLVWAWSLAFYMRQFIFPQTLSHHYFVPEPVSVFNSEYQLALFFLFCVFLFIFLFRRFRMCIFSLCFFLLSIFPVLRNKAAVTHVVADRFMYLSCLGFCFLFAVIIERLLSLKGGAKRYLRKSVLAGCGVVLVFFCFQTFQYSKVWRNDVAFWEYVYTLKPSRINSLICYKLGRAYQTESNFEQALSTYRNHLYGKADKHLSDHERQEVELVEKVIALYEQGITIKPTMNDHTYASLKNIYQVLKK